MRITVKLHGTLRKFLPAGANNAVAFDFGDGANVGDIVTRLGIPAGHAKIIISGDQQLDLGSALHEGQEINLFPPLAGG